MASFALIALAAFMAGIVNALAGGGTFLTFPALIAAGLPPIAANASSTVALYPGYFVSAWAGRKSFRLVEGMRALNVIGTVHVRNLSRCDADLELRWR